MVILQFCTWHCQEAIKRKLVHAGYKKSPQKAIHLIWKWIEAPDRDALEIARDELILSLKVAEKEYLVGWYQPKEPQFCKAYTSQYLNLGSYATTRIEGNHPVVTAQLHKNLRVSDAIMKICNGMENLARDHESALTSSRRDGPRLFDRDFFSVVFKRITLYCLEEALRCPELVVAIRLGDAIDRGEVTDNFDPDIGCLEGCSLPLQYLIPCRHWMYHFYRKKQPIPINLFHPRWLFDGPSVIQETWKMRLDNYDYSKGQPVEDRFAGDRSQGAGAKLLLNTALVMVEKHKSLPAGEKEPFALAFKKMCDSLNSQYDEKLQRLQQFPHRLRINSPASPAY